MSMWGFPKIRGTILGSPLMVMVFTVYIGVPYLVGKLLCAQNCPCEVLQRHVSLREILLALLAGLGITLPGEPAKIQTQLKANLKEDPIVLKEANFQALSRE